MTELKIQKLGPIKSLNIKIKQFNLMIGEQATGKSTICKAVYLFRELKALLVDYLYGIAVNGKSVMPFPLEMDERTEDVFFDLYDAEGKYTGILSGGTGDIIVDEELCQMGYFGNDRNKAFMEEVLGAIDVYG